METEREEVDGAAVLDEARYFIRKFAVLPSEAALNAVTLWAAHTHAHQAFTTSPRLAILADQPGCGKTRLLELAGLLSANATMEVDPTGPALTAMIDQQHPTVLIDETDMIWGTGGGNAKRQLRAILNSGYRQGAALTRRSGQTYIKSSIYGPVALAGNGILPQTLMERSVVVRMRKPKDGERIEKFMPRMHCPEGRFIGDALGNWVSSVALDLATSWPDLPDGIEDRAAEVWEPLIAIADQAGGHWPSWARAACTELALNVSEQPVLSPGQRILSDLRAVWTGQNLPTATIIRRLFEVQGSPWRSMWPESQAPRELASLLRQYGVEPTKIKEDGRPLQGYKRTDLEPVWDRLVPAPQVPDLHGSGGSGRIAASLRHIFDGPTCGPDCEHEEHRRVNV